SGSTAPPTPSASSARRAGACRRPGGEQEGMEGAVEVLGIDIGGSGIKVAPADVTAGALTRERVKVLTPQPATPKAVAEAVRGVVAQFGWARQARLPLPRVW